MTEVEFALLVLLRRAGEIDDDDLTQLGSESNGLTGEVESASASQAVSVLAAHVRTDGPVGLAAGVQGLVLTARIPDSEAVSTAADLAAELLAAVGVAPDDERAGRLIATTQRLREVFDPELIESDKPDLDSEILPGLEAAFAPWLTTHRSGLLLQHVTVMGRAATITAMLMESTAQYAVGCVSAFPGDGFSTKNPVTYVRLEACTSLPFETCRQRIDPMHWVDCNPFFSSVESLRHTSVDPNGWYGAIREKVGPGLNHEYYTTDLRVRYIEQPQIAATTFDLCDAKDRKDDGRVSVDRGFLAVIDETTHRRVQMLKVYRIEDYDAPHRWVCPLWAKQFVLSGWACGAAGPMRRALEAWNGLIRNVVALGHHACNSLQCECQAPPGAPVRSRVAPLSHEHYEIPLPASCPQMFTDATAQACVSVLASKKSVALAPPQVVKVEFDQAALVPCATKFEADPDPDTKVMSLAPSATATLSSGTPPYGLYLGRLSDKAAGVDVPFTLYDAGL